MLPASPATIAAKMGRLGTAQKEDLVEDRKNEGAGPVVVATLSCLLLAACAMAPANVDFPDRPAEEEQLVDVPNTQPAPAVVSDPKLVIVAVSVEPPQVDAGQAANLIVSYSLTGVPAGATLDVEERRELIKEGASIQQMLDTLPRGSGPHNSSKPIVVPLEAAPGIYTLKVTLSAAGVWAEKTAIFEVR